MFRTIFGKIMLLFMAIILISLYISGLMMTQMTRQSYLTNSQNQMIKTSQDGLQVVDFYNQGYLVRGQLDLWLKNLAAENNDLIWWIEYDGTLNRYGNSEHEISLEEIQGYYDEMLEEVISNEYAIKIVEENNPFNTPLITVARTKNYESIGYEYIFVHKELSSLNNSLMNVYRQIILSIAIAGMLAIVVTYIFTRYLLRPLSIVTKGANQLARGHFDIWLEVRSEDEIGQLADTFNVLAQDLRKYEQTKDSFIANVSHEMRSPLTSMQGLIQGVIDGTIPEDEQLHYLEIVLDETKRLNSLITNMLNLAKIESGQFPLQLEEIEVNELLRRALITFETKIDVKNLMVEVEFENDQELALADKNQVIQVIQNLVDNAIKFADYGGRLRLSTMSNETEVFISVNNTGDPIPRSSIPYLFDRFYKGDESHTRVREGTGIGLSIVKRILEEHRQKIWVESDRIGGTTFTFTLSRIATEKKPEKRPEKKLEKKSKKA